MNKNSYTFFENVVINSIDLEAYDLSNELDLFDKVQNVYSIFKSEKGWEIEKVGEFNAFVSWLQGLPSALTVPFYYHEQIELAKKEGYLSKTVSERKQEKFCECFFYNCANSFFTLKNNL